MDDDRLSRIETLWSLVRRAHGDRLTAAGAAQHSLLERYGRAVRRYALAALRDEDAADDVFQEFSLKFVRGDFSGVDPQRGRFRSFVKSVVYRLIVDHQRRQVRGRRVGPMHTGVPEPVADPTPVGAGQDELFLKSWRDELLARSWAALEQQEQATSKPYHTALRLRVDKPDLRSPQLAEQLSAILGKPMAAGAVRVLLHRARDTFANHLLDQVLDTLQEPSLDAAEEELIELDLLAYCRPALEKRRGS